MIWFKAFGYVVLGDGEGGYVAPWAIPHPKELRSDSHSAIIRYEMNKDI